MATINPYSTPAEAPIISNYMPLPFEEIMQAGAMQQQRYDENVGAVQQFEENDLDTLYGAKSITDPLTGEVVQLNDAKIIGEYQTQFRDRINKLDAQYSDKGSPEYRNAVKSMIRSYRKESGPNGIIGMAKSNLQSISDFNKLQQENPQAIANRHLLVPFSQRIQAMKNQSGIAPINLNMPVGEAVDINSKLTDFFKHKVASFEGVTMEQLNGSVPELMAILQQKGVDKDDLAVEAYQYLLRDPEARNDIALQAAAEQSLYEDPRTADEITKEYAVGAGNLFGYSQVDMKTYVDQSIAEKRKQKELDFGIQTSRPVAGFRRGTGIENQSQLIQAKDIAREAVDRELANYINVMRDAGLTVNPDGSVDDWVLNGEDMSTSFNAEKDALDKARLNMQKLASFERDLRKKFGIDRLERDPEYLAAREAAMVQVIEDEIVLRSKAASGPGKDVSTAVMSKMRPIVEEEVRKNFALDPMAEIDKFAKYMPDKYRSKVEGYNKAILERSEDGTFVAAANTLGPKLNERFENEFMLYFSDPSVSTDRIVDFESGVEIAEWDDLNKAWDGKGDVDVSESNPPKFAGWFYDDDRFGQVSLMYNIKDKDGKVVRHVKVPAPDNFEALLIDSGNVNAGAATVNRKLTGRLGVLGDPEVLQQNIYVSGTGETLLSESGDDSTLNLKVLDKNTQANGRYLVKYTDTDGIVRSEDFKNKAQLINYITTIAVAYRTKNKQ